MLVSHIFSMADDAFEDANIESFRKDTYAIILIWDAVKKKSHIDWRNWEYFLTLNVIQRGVCSLLCMEEVRDELR